MSAKGILQALFWCSLFIVCIFFWKIFRESQVSEKVILEYYRLPENCGSSRSWYYPCDATIEKLLATDSEKFWLKRHDLDFIVPAIFFWGLILFILWITKQKNISKIDLNNNWNKLDRKSELLKETELYINTKNSLEKDKTQALLEPVTNIKNEKDTKFDWDEKPFEYKQNNIF